VEHAPDIDVIAPLHVENQVRILFQTPATQTGKVQFTGIASRAGIRMAPALALVCGQVAQARGAIVERTIFTTYDLFVLMHTALAYGAYGENASARAAVATCVISPDAMFAGSAGGIPIRSTGNSAHRAFAQPIVRPWSRDAAACTWLRWTVATSCHRCQDFSGHARPAIRYD
jgi:hypothetical protein